MNKLKISLLLAALFAPLAAHAELKVASVEFTPTLAPETDAERTSFYTRSSAIVTYSNGTKKVFPLSYQPLYHSAEKIGHWQAGAIVDNDGKLILRSAANADGEVAQGPFFSYAPDANSLLGTQKGKNTAYLMTHFEYNTEAPNVDANKPPVQLYAQLPAAINKATVLQDKKTGQVD